MLWDVKGTETHEEAERSSNRSEWKLAVKEELDSIGRNNTWSQTVSPPDKDAIQCELVLKLNLDKEGRIVRNKARLVPRTYVQMYGDDDDETSPHSLSIEQETRCPCHSWQTVVAS